MHYNRRTALKMGAAIAGTSLVAGRVAAATPWQSPPTSPSSDSKPWVRWWWPGGAVEDGELRREIGLLKTAGFGGAEIQAFNPAIPNLTSNERTRLNDYANPAFFEHVAACANEAKKDGLKIDYTFGSSWPSGGGFAVTPELALVELTPAVTSIVAPTASIKIDVPAQTKKFGAMGSLDSRNKDPRAADWKERLQRRWKLVAVIAVKGDAPNIKAGTKGYRDSNVELSGKIETGAGIDVTSKLQSDGTLAWTPPSDGAWQIIAFKQYTVDSSVMAGVGEGPQLILDHFNKAAFEAHAERVGAPLDALGADKSGLRAMFIDSLELMTDLYWSDSFLSEFSTRRGYNLVPYLHLILQPGWEAPWNPRYSPPYFETGDDLGDRIRNDYRETVSELLIENFFKPYVDWCAKHGFESRLQANGSPADVMASFGLADIPETEDLGANGDTHFLRLARAAADIYGKPLVSCESLCWIGKPYEITPAQWLARANFLFASGVNAMIMHGFPYALHTDKWPGWFPFAPSPFLSGFSSQINEANPLWAGIPTLNTYIHRAQSLLQSGHNRVKLAVLMTNAGYGHNKGDDEIAGWLTALLKSGFDYDRISQDGLMKSTPRSNSLVTLGGCEYQALIVPALQGLAPETADRVAALAKAGVKIIFVDRLPERSSRFSHAVEDDKRVRGAVAATGSQATPSATLVDRLLALGIEPNIRFASDPCLFIEKVDGDQRLFVLHNESDTPRTIKAHVKARGVPVRIDLFTGEHIAIASTKSGDWTSIEIDILGGAAAFVTFVASAPKTRSLQFAGNLPVSSKWHVDAKGHGNRGRLIELSLAEVALADFATLNGLRDFSGQANYQTNVHISPAAVKKSRQIALDLGVVNDMAIVRVNGKVAGTLITAPFTVDITRLLKAGDNALEIQVFNGPNNAMIDAKYPGMKDLKQKPAGLIGPVTVQLKA